MVIFLGNVIGTITLSFMVIEGDVESMGMKQLDGRRYGASIAFLLVSTFVSYIYNYFLNYNFSARKAEEEGEQEQ